MSIILIRFSGEELLRSDATDPAELVDAAAKLLAVPACLLIFLQEDGEEFLSSEELRAVLMPEEPGSSEATKTAEQQLAQAVRLRVAVSGPDEYREQNGSVRAALDKLSQLPVEKWEGWFYFNENLPSTMSLEDAAELVRSLEARAAETKGWRKRRLKTRLVNAIDAWSFSERQQFYWKLLTALVDGTEYLGSRTGIRDRAGQFPFEEDRRRGLMLSMVANNLVEFVDDDGHYLHLERFILGHLSEPEGIYHEGWAEVVGWREVVGRVKVRAVGHRNYLDRVFARLAAGADFLAPCWTAKDAENLETCLRLLEWSGRSISNFSKLRPLDVEYRVAEVTSDVG